MTNLRSKDPGYWAKRQREENTRHKDHRDTSSLRSMVCIFHAIDFRREARHDCSQDRVGDNEAARAEHEWLLPSHGIEDQGNEAIRAI